MSDLHANALAHAVAAFKVVGPDIDTLEPWDGAVEAAIRAYIMALPTNGEESSRFVEHVKHAWTLLEEVGLQDTIWMQCAPDGIKIIFRMSIRLTAASRFRKEISRTVPWHLLEDHLRPGNPLLGAINQVKIEAEAEIAKHKGKPNA